MAAVSVQLFSGDTELHVSGPVQISLSLPDSSGLQASNVVPAWFFNRTTGEKIITIMHAKKHLVFFDCRRIGGTLGHFLANFDIEDRLDLLLPQSKPSY